MAEHRQTGEPVNGPVATSPAAAPEPPAIAVMMGVSGSGKTLIGGAVATAAGARFIDGDHYHPPENISRMRSGLPLRDVDRRGLLDAIAAEIAAVERQVPTLGICLGAQLLAVAGGGHVEVNAPAGVEAGVIEVRLRPAAETDPVLGPSVYVKAVHFTEMRAALDAAYAAAGRTAPAYVDPILSSGYTWIRAAHVTDLRDAVEALEQ